MRSDQYTADAICRSMGLDAFEPAGPAPSLRVILKPSFHPEVCITVYTSIEERSEISVIALKEMVWRQCVVHRLQSVQESTTVPSEDFIGAFEGYEISQSSDTCTDRSIRIDGMGIDCCLLSAHGIHRRYVNVHGPTIETFIGHQIGRAHV